jgi:hypothetical protein
MNFWKIYGEVKKVELEENEFANTVILHVATSENFNSAVMPIEIWESDLRRMLLTTDEKELKRSNVTAIGRFKTRVKTVGETKKDVPCLHADSIQFTQL